MKGTYTDGKIESFGTRLVQWQDTRGPDIQARMNQLGELMWSVQHLQIQGNLIRYDNRNKMTSEIKSQDATSHRDYKNNNQLIGVS
jgi:hypothetical protein